jgi:hypothetical protein
MIDVEIHKGFSIDGCEARRFFCIHHHHPGDIARWMSPDIVYELTGAVDRLKVFYDFLAFRPGGQSFLIGRFNLPKLSPTELEEANFPETVKRVMKDLERFLDVGLPQEATR